jgi:hypothetical protein
MDYPPAINPESETNRQELLLRCRKLLSNALNLPTFDADLSRPLLSAMQYVPLSDASESASSSTQPAANGIQVNGTHHQPIPDQVLLPAGLCFTNLVTRHYTVSFRDVETGR